MQEDYRGGAGQKRARTFGHFGTALSVASYLLGDLTADLRVDGRNFVAFRTAFDEANGVGSFVAMFNAIPELATGWLAAP